MATDKEKLLIVMRSLEKDYKDGKISEEKYRYFKTKYEDRLHSLNTDEASNRIRSMQGKSNPQQLNRKQSKKSKKTNRQTEQDLVQKYIVNPKKGDKDLNKTKKKPMDAGTFKLVAVLVLIIGFTCGIGFGIFNFDFDGMSTVNAEAICEDTAFPEVDEVVNVTNTTTSSSTSSDTSYSESSTQDTESSCSSDSSYYPETDSGSTSSGSSSSGSESGSSTSSGSSSSGSTGGGDSGTVETSMWLRWMYEKKYYCNFNNFHNFHFSQCCWLCICFW